MDRIRGAPRHPVLANLCELAVLRLKGFDLTFSLRSLVGSGRTSGA
jgi:hypothetical protein